MKLYDQLKIDALQILIQEMKSLQDEGLMTEVPFTSDHCFNVFYCETDLSESQLKVFTEVYYENEDAIHQILEDNR